jgi:HPt (histidine-containing phosphotransfer) domain-containing protein
MDKRLSDNAFVFSDAINSQYIIDLYAGDYVMIEETFADVLNEYDAFVERIITSYHEKDLQALKSAVHKIKPLFGFVGLTTIQASCLEFENSCLQASDAQLAESFSPLKDQLLKARAVIEKEKIRLTEFNHQ